MDRKPPSIFLSIPWLLGWVSFSIMGPYLMIKLIYKSLQVVITDLFNTQIELQGKVVLITGASSGLGLALAHSLYKRGCKLILASRNIERLQEIKEHLLREYNPPELHIPYVVYLDLEDLNSIPKVVDETLKANGGYIDVLINNAGISYRGEIASTDISIDLKLMLVNYFGQVALTKSILKYMISRNKGHIIGVSSLQGKIALPYRSCYSASKHAFQAFLDSLRSEVSKHNIQVTVASPGYIETNLSQNAVHGGSNASEYETQTKGASAESVASKISEYLISKPHETLIAPFPYRLVVYFRNIFPSLYFYMMQLRAKGMSSAESSIKINKNKKRC